MPITLLIAPEGCGKTSVVLQRLAQSGDAGQAACIAPTEGQARLLLKRFLETYQRRCALGQCTFGIHSWIQLLSDTDTAFISEGAQRLLWHRLLDQHLDSHIAAHEWMHLLRRAAQCGISIQALAQSCVHSRSKRWHQIARALTDYQSHLQRAKLHDVAMLWERAREHISTGTCGWLKKRSLLLFDHFVCPDDGVVRLIASIATAHPQLEIIITHPSPLKDSAPDAQWLVSGIDRLQRIADRIEHLPVQNPRIVPIPCRVASPEAQARFILQQALERSSNDRSAAVVVRNARSAAHLHALYQIHQTSSYTVPTLTSTYPPEMRTWLDETLPQRLPQQANISEMCRISIEMLNAKTPEHWRMQLADETLRGTAAREICAIHELRAQIQLLNDTQVWLLDPPIRREHFLELLLQSSTTNTFIDELPFEVTSFDHGLVAPVDLVILPDMYEAAFQRIEYSTLLGGNDAEALPELVQRLLPDASVQIAREWHGVHRALVKARAEALLVLPAVDTSGRETVFPHIWRDELEAPADLDVPLFTPTTTAEERATLTFRANIEWERKNALTEHPEYHGQLRDPQALALIDQRFRHQPLSVSALDRYAHTPFEFFIQNVLGLHEQDELRPDVMPNTRGKLIHTALEHCYRENSSWLPDALARSDWPRITAAMEQSIDIAWNTLKRDLRQSDPVLHPFLQQEVRAALTNILRTDATCLRSASAPLTPHLLEWTFGEEGQPQVSIPVPDDVPQKLCGRVDRIDSDVGMSRFLILDYKSGKVESIATKIKRGKHLQIPLYIEAVRQVLMPNALELGGALVSSRADELEHGMMRKTYNSRHFIIGSRKHSLMNDEQFEALLRQALVFSGTAAAGIRRGDFDTRAGEAEYDTFADAYRLPDGDEA